MAKFHVNPKTLEVGKCRAQKDGCPFGGVDEHFSNAKAAGIFAESQALMPESHRKGTKNLKDGALLWGAKSFSDAPSGTRVDIGGFRYTKLANDSWGKGFDSESKTDLQMDALGSGRVSTDGYEFSAGSHNGIAERANKPTIGKGAHALYQDKNVGVSFWGSSAVTATDAVGTQIIRRKDGIAFEVYENGTFIPVAETDPRMPRNADAPLAPGFQPTLTAGARESNRTDINVLSDGRIRSRAGRVYIYDVPQEVERDSELKEGEYNFNSEGLFIRSNGKLYHSPFPTTSTEANKDS